MLAFESCLKIHELIKTIFVEKIHESSLSSDPTLSSFMPKIFDLALKWVETEQASAKALDLMRTVVLLGNNGDSVCPQPINLMRNISEADEDVGKYLKEFEIIIPKMLSKIERNEILSEQVLMTAELIKALNYDQILLQVIALFKVMIALLRHPKMQTVVLSTFTESYFDKMFSPLINTDPESLNYAKFSSDDLAQYLLCLQILIEFSNIAPKVWQSKIVRLFDKKQIHYVIARGVLCENENLCQVVFEMAKTTNFPRDDVAKVSFRIVKYIFVFYLSSIHNSWAERFVS